MTVIRSHKQTARTTPYSRRESTPTVAVRSPKRRAGEPLEHIPTIDELKSLDNGYAIVHIDIFRCRPPAVTVARVDEVAEVLAEEAAESQDNPLTPSYIPASEFSSPDGAASQWADDNDPETPAYTPVSEFSDVE